MSGFVLFGLACWSQKDEHFRKYFYPLDSAEECHLLETWTNSKIGLSTNFAHSTNLKSLIYQEQMMQRNL